MKKLTALFFALLPFASFAQVDPLIWNKLKTISSENYEFKVPENWRAMPTGQQGPEQLLEASGLALPKDYNSKPVIVTLFFVKQEGNSLDVCKDKALSGYHSNPDRVFPADFTDGAEKTKTAAGQDAWFLNTRFFRKSKGLNQSRYDFVVWSGKAKAGYLYTLSVQYDDPDYDFEKDNKLEEFARKLYGYLKVKE
ncbi:MAG: hypothetical protein V4543_11990 [Bacteroidota bacterium]